MINFVLTILFGWLGYYRICKKQYGKALLYFFTLGLFCVGWIYDCILSYNENVDDVKRAFNNHKEKFFSFKHKWLLHVCISIITLVVVAMSIFYNLYILLIPCVIIEGIYISWHIEFRRNLQKGKSPTKEKRKLNHYSIFCICYLTFMLLVSIAISIAFCCGTLKFSENYSTNLILLFIVLFYFIAPPLIWFVTLVCSKRLFFNIEAEQKRALKKYEKSDLKIINDYISDFTKNKSLITVITNYVRSNTDDIMKNIMYLELAVLPLKNAFRLPEGNDNDIYLETDKWIAYLNIETDYITFAKNFNSDFLETCKYAVRTAYKSRDSFLYPNTHFVEFNKLYQSVINQNIINNTNEDNLMFYAFLYLIYRNCKMIYCEDLIMQIEKYDIDKNCERGEIIDKLYYKGVKEETISSTIFALDEYKNNFTSSINIQYKAINMYVKDKILQITGKETIESLLSADIHDVTPLNVETLDSKTKNIIITIKEIDNMYTKYNQDKEMITILRNFVEKKVYEYGRYFEYFLKINEDAISIIDAINHMDFDNYEVKQFISSVYNNTFPFKFVKDITSLPDVQLKESYTENVQFLIKYTKGLIYNFNELISSLVETEKIENKFSNKYAILILLNNIRVDKVKKLATTELINKSEIDISQNDNEIIKEILTDNLDYDESKLSAFIAVLKSKDDQSFFTRTNVLDEKIKKIHKKLYSETYLRNLSKTNDDNDIDISDIDLMSGSQFEIFVTKLFNDLGYKAERTKESGDQGVDIIAEKDGVKFAIQTKCYSKPVGNHAIMEVVGGVKYYDADKIMVVTNSTFTKSARELAQANNVILWDRSILKEKMEEV